MGNLTPSPPCCATIVTPPSIRLEHLNRAAREAIAQQGLKIGRDSFGYEAILYEDDGRTIGNRSFECAMTGLARAGIAFAEDYKQGWAPADIMRELRETGAFVGTFKTLAWDGEKYLLKESLSP